MKAISNACEGIKLDFILDFVNLLGYIKKSLND
jgi:hypothetical protein